MSIECKDDIQVIERVEGKHRESSIEQVIVQIAAETQSKPIIETHIVLGALKSKFGIEPLKKLLSRTLRTVRVQFGIDIQRVELRSSEVWDSSA
jgi:hypothetical protein